MRARDTKQEDRILSVPPSLLYTPTHILTADLTVETLYQELQNAGITYHFAHRICGGKGEEIRRSESMGCVGGEGEEPRRLSLQGYE